MTIERERECKQRIWGKTIRSDTNSATPNFWNARHQENFSILIYCRPLQCRSVHSCLLVYVIANLQVAPVRKCPCGCMFHVTALTCLCLGRGSTCSRHHTCSATLAISLAIDRLLCQHQQFNTTANYISETHPSRL